MSLSAFATSERSRDPSVTLLRCIDVVLVVVAAPIMLLIGVPAAGYLVGAGAWILLRAVGVGVDRYAGAIGPQGWELTLRLCYLLGRLFLLATAIILVRKDLGKDDGLTTLLVIVFAFTMQLAGSIATRAWKR